VIADPVAVVTDAVDSAETAEADPAAIAEADVPAEIVIVAVPGPQGKHHLILD